MKKIIFVLVLVVAVLFVAYFIIKKNPQSAVFTPSASPTTTITVSTSSGGPMVSDSEKAIVNAAVKKVSIKNFSFECT